MRAGGRVAPPARQGMGRLAVLPEQGPQPVAAAAVASRSLPSLPGNRASPLSLAHLPLAPSLPVLFPCLPTAPGAPSPYLLPPFASLLAQPGTQAASILLGLLSPTLFITSMRARSHSFLKLCLLCRRMAGCPTHSYRQAELAALLSSCCSHPPHCCSPALRTEALDPPRFPCAVPVGWPEAR